LQNTADANKRGNAEEKGNACQCCDSPTSTNKRQSRGDSNSISKHEEKYADAIGTRFTAGPEEQRCIEQPTATQKARLPSSKVFSHWQCKMPKLVLSSILPSYCNSPLRTALTK